MLPGMHSCSQVSLSHDSPLPVNWIRPLVRDGEEAAVRFREDNPAELARARIAVAAWREQNSAGTGEDLIAAVGHQFHRDYGVVLRAVLFAVDRHRAREVTGIATGYFHAARDRT